MHQQAPGTSARTKVEPRLDGAPLVTPRVCVKIPPRGQGDVDRAFAATNMLVGMQGSDFLLALIEAGVACLDARHETV
jgi:hypothetical protein